MATNAIPGGPWFVAVGASGGDGLAELTHLVGALGPRPEAVVMVVLHRMFDRPSELRSILARESSMPVVIASPGETLKPGRCYLGGPAEHLTLRDRSHAGLVRDSARRYRNRTVDLLLLSIAARAGSRSVGVVLSGSLDDGSRGLAAIHDAGGTTMVLRRPPPFIAGMPENAIAFDGPIDFIGSAVEIAARIGQTVAKREAA